MAQSLNKMELPVAVRNLQIIVLAMTAGVVILAVIVIILARPAAGAPLLSYVAVAAAAMALGARFVLPSLYVAQGVKRLTRVEPASADVPSTEEQLTVVLVTSTILAAALLEGAAFFNLVAYLLEAQWFSLLAVGLLVAAILAQFPRQSTAAAWMDRRKREINDLRQLGGRN